MKRSQYGVTAAIVLLAGGAISGAAVPAAADGSGDLAVGSAVMPFPPPVGPGSATLSVDAHTDADGRAFGSVHAQGNIGSLGDFEVAGPVTCLRVAGNKAAIKYPFTKANGVFGPLKGGGIEIFIQDNGASPSTVGYLPPQPPGLFDLQANQCDDPNLVPTFNKVTSGSYTVR